MDPTDTRYGTVTEEPGGVRLEFRRTWPDDADDVWAALTAPDRTARWIGSYDGERRTGATGRFTMAFEDGAPAEPMTVVECIEPHRLVLEWPGTGRRVEIDLVAQRGGTTLIFLQRLAGTEGVPDVAAGWHWYLDTLDAEVSGTEPPGDRDAFLAARAGRAGPPGGEPRPGAARRAPARLHLRVPSPGQADCSTCTGSGPSHGPSRVSIRSREASRGPACTG